MNSRIKRRNKFWGYSVGQGGNTSNFNEFNKAKYGIGDYRDVKYRYSYTDIVLRNMITLLKKLAMPYNINKRRLGVKSWRKLVMLQKQHQW